MRAPWVLAPARAGATALIIAVLALGVSAPRAAAFNPFKKACGVAGLISKLAGKACDVLQGGRLLKAGKQLLGGNLSGAGKTLLGDGASRAGTALGFAAAGAWVLGGAKAALQETEKEIGATTSPRLQSTWFSGTYWRVAGIGALLTLPFLFAAALQALVRSDLSLLAHAAFGYLPLALLTVSIAAPLTMLVLAASDEMCMIVSSTSGGAGVTFLKWFGGIAGGLSALDGSPFLAFLVGALLTGAALAVSLELLVRDAAVYVVVLMLPLAFAAMVWPARRIWAVRAVETLVALILAKFAIVAVLALAGGALGSASASGMFAGTALVMLAAFSPLVLFRLLPFAELAAGASGALRGERARFDTHVSSADRLSGAIELWGTSLTRGMTDDAERSSAPAGPREEAPRPDPVGHATGTPVTPAALNPAGAGSTPPAAGDGVQYSPTPERPERPERPRMDPHWHAGDGEWDTMVFGPDSYPSAPLRSREGDAAAPGPADGGGEADDGSLPAAPDPEDGRL